MSRVGAFVPLEVTGVTRETEDAISVSFAPHPGFAFRPGQYLTFRTVIGKQETRRSYSICSAPGECLRVAIKRVDEGRFTSWAHATLAAGHRIEAMPPEGRFVLPAGTAPRHVLAVAAGSGITPVLAILCALLEDEPGSRATLLYGSRSTGGILFRERLEELKDRHMARLSVVHVLSREQQDIPVLNGRLDGEKVRALLPGALPDVAMLCGPGGMIASVTEGLVAAGMARDRILSERFTPDGEPVRPRKAQVPGAAPFATATIIADGVATDVPMLEDEPVLDAALRAGLDLPYSCRGGMCSTCRARVTEGAVTMAVNYGLEPWETASGYVLTCQSRPITAHVTVDYDHV